jgi:hypothetical protein
MRLCLLLSQRMHAMSNLRLLVIVLVAACGGGGSDPPPQVDAPDNLPACTRAVYDPCTTNDECESGNCHLFMMDGIQVCTQPCTPNDNSTCPTDEAGQESECNNRGICKPTVENACAP